jgi:hypothetical protein
VAVRLHLMCEQQDAGDVVLFHFPPQDDRQDARVAHLDVAGLRDPDGLVALFETNS